MKLDLYIQFHHPSKAYRVKSLFEEQRDLFYVPDEFRFDHITLPGWKTTCTGPSLVCFKACTMDPVQFLAWCANV